MSDTQPPGTLRPIPDPQAEMERLARARMDLPGRVWAIQHPNGQITVRISGWPFETRDEAAGALRDMPPTCCEGRHALVYRDTPPWREA